VNGLKTGIPIIGVIIAVAILLIFATTQEEVNQFTDPQIEKLLEQVKETKILNEQSEQPFVPQTPTWDNISGPFMIDNHEYWLGQKIFVNISGLQENEKGKINFYTPLENERFRILYSSMGFDGSVIRNNYYFTPSLQPVNGICVKEQLIGEWQIKFEGTQHPDLHFTIIDKKIPGFEFLFNSVEGQGLC
jgi:hypothetical protein